MRAEWINAASAAVVAIFTVVLTYVAHGQWRLMEEAEKDSRERERAFVYPEVKLTPGRDSANRMRYWRIQVSLVNNGNTQTKNLRWVWNGAVNFRPNPEETEIPIQFSQAITVMQLGQLNGQQGGGYLHPKASFPIADLRMDRQSVYELISGNPFHFVGRADYDDIFGDPRTTRFCFQVYGGPWDRRAESADAAIDEFSIAQRPCTKNNCTDAECAKGG